MTARHAFLAILSLAATACASRLEVSAPGQVDLSGQWTLNTQLSTNPEAVVREQQRRSRQRDRRPEPASERNVGGVLDNSPSRPPEAGMHGGSGYGALWERAIRERIDMLSPGASLAISQAPNELSIVSGDSSVRYGYGDKVIISVPDGAADRIAGWDGHRFRVRTSAPDGLRSERTFELTSAGRQLIVTTEVSGDGPNAVARLVYDRAGT